MILNKTSLSVFAISVLISGCSGSPTTQPANDPETVVNPGSSEQTLSSENGGILNQDPLLPNGTMLRPTVVAGSDTDRLLKGINRQVSRTLLDFNARLRGGIPLTTDQDVCLGSYDPAVGQQLLAINCAQPQATDDVLIYVEQAEYYATAECHAAIFDGNTNDCFLKNASLSTPTVWSNPERPANVPSSVPYRPQPISPGINISYAVNTTYLDIESSMPAVLGIFQCSINLLNNETSTTANLQNCRDTINLAANRFDTLLPPTE